jgi:hypothetical protein
MEVSAQDTSLLAEIDQLRVLHLFVDLGVPTPSYGINGISR